MKAKKMLKVIFPVLVLLMLVIVVIFSVPRPAFSQKRLDSIAEITLYHTQQDCAVYTLTDDRAERLISLLENARITGFSHQKHTEFTGGPFFPFRIIYSDGSYAEILSKNYLVKNGRGYNCDEATLKGIAGLYDEITDELLPLNRIYYLRIVEAGDIQYFAVTDTGGKTVYCDDEDIEKIIKAVSEADISGQGEDYSVKDGDATFKVRGLNGTELTLSAVKGLGLCVDGKLFNCDDNTVELVENIYKKYVR